MSMIPYLKLSCNKLNTQPFRSTLMRNMSMSRKFPSLQSLNGPSIGVIQLKNSFRDNRTRFKHIMLGMVLGGTLSCGAILSDNPISNEFATPLNGTEFQTIESKNSAEATISAIMGDTEEERHRKYRQLCVGSILGIVSGLLMVKVSAFLIYLTVFGLLSFEWLRSRNIIQVNGEELIKFGRNRGEQALNIGKFHIKNVNLFKFSFLCTLILTYING